MSVSHRSNVPLGQSRDRKDFVSARAMDDPLLQAHANLRSSVQLILNLIQSNWPAGALYLDST